jgi:methionyl-tRNA synthetase
MEQITWDDFAKVEFRIGEIVEAKAVEGSDKLIKEVVDFGEFGQKIAFSGIRKYYNPEELIGKKTVFVVNMVPKKIMGEESQVMVFACEDEINNKLSILILDKDLANGSRVF